MYARVIKEDLQCSLQSSFVDLMADGLFELFLTSTEKATDKQL